MTQNTIKKDVGSFLRNLLRSRKPEMLPRMEDEPQQLAAARARSEWAKDLLASDCFQQAIQYMNEQIVQEIGSADILDKDRLTVLQLELKLVTKFQYTLEAFVDEYATILQIQKISQQRYEES